MKRHPDLPLPLNTSVSDLAVSTLLELMQASYKDVIMQNLMLPQQQKCSRMAETSVPLLALQSSSCPPGTFPATPEPLHENRRSTEQ